MSENNTSGQARKGLFDSVKGKAKEIVGAVTGNDSLTAEGQLEQSQAQERKEANTVEAVADAETNQADKELVQAKLEGAQQRAQTNAEAAVVEDAIEKRREGQKQAAQLAGQRDAAREKVQADLEAQRDVEQAKAQERAEIDAAGEDFVEAVDEHQSAVQEAAATQSEADRIRAQADRRQSAADLP